jgi:hypothetical protein
MPAVRELVFCDTAAPAVVIDAGIFLSSALGM